MLRQYNRASFDRAHSVVAIVTLQVETCVEMGVTVDGVLANAKVGRQRVAVNGHFVGKCIEHIAQGAVGGQLIGHFSKQKRVAAQIIRQTESAFGIVLLNDFDNLFGQAR